ncbi:hypothetical protein [Paraburkholderia phosphatilytica]|uniref:hypothetical protein n=1 Tax=Paraburkholderia phosphatilytica TaxID=2282883 RepID=UPI000E534BD4|nr:hypothetical protein [Paraburkholderia phosphatilytica]
MGKPRDWFADELTQLKHTFAGTITPLKMARDRRRAESIRDVVDAYRRLNESVCRFIAMLSMSAIGQSALPEPDNAAATRTMPFALLLSTLEARAMRASFGGLAQLRRVIAEARHAEQHRDVIFAPPVDATETQLRRAAAALDRLDAAFVGLCVSHVLAQRAGEPSEALPRALLN